MPVLPTPKNPAELLAAFSLKGTSQPAFTQQVPTPSSPEAYRVFYKEWNQLLKPLSLQAESIKNSRQTVNGVSISENTMRRELHIEIHPETFLQLSLTHGYEPSEKQLNPNLRARLDELKQSAGEEKTQPAKPAQLTPARQTFGASFAPAQDGGTLGPARRPGPLGRG